jgi:hypothetical protein
MKFTTTSLSLLGFLPYAAGAELEHALFRGGASAQRRLPDDACLEGSYAGGEGSMGTCCMPTELDHDFLTNNFELTANVQHRQGPTGDETSYWYIQFDDDPAKAGSLAGLDLTGWCVDLSRGLGSGTRTFDVFSTYDDWNYDHALDSPDKLPNVNWMINNFRLGEYYIVPANHSDECGNSDETIKLEWNTFQNSVWRTIDRGMTASGIHEQSAANKCLQWYMVAQADALGDGYVPSCDDPDAEVAVLVVYDDDSQDNTIKGQVIIGEVKLSELPGACKLQECCEEMVVDHEVFQENKEIAVTFTKGGSSGAAWDVQFLQGSDVYSTSLGMVEAWSVDLDRDDAAAQGTFAVDTYSSYDNWYRYNAVDKKQNIPLANWLINNLPVGSRVGSCSGAQVSVDDFQNAIWDLMDFWTQNRGSPNSCVVSFLGQEAQANGVDYEPSCAAGTTDKIAVLLIVDDGDTYKTKYGSGGWTNDESQIFDYVVNQVIIAAVPVGQVTGSCHMKDCGCCALPDEDFDIPDENEERDAPVSAPTPIDEIGTPAPVNRVVPCEDPIDILGSEFGGRCGHKGVELLATNPDFESSGNQAPALRVDIRDIFFGITTGSNDISVIFRAQNPFEGGAVDMYVEYRTAVGTSNLARDVTCVAGPNVDKCRFMGEGNTIMEAACIDNWDPAKPPYTVVTVFFVERGNDLFDVTYTNNVPQCCHADPNNDGSVISYTFEILCACPEGSDAFTRE